MPWPVHARVGAAAPGLSRGWWLPQRALGSPVPAAARVPPALVWRAPRPPPVAPPPTQSEHMVNVWGYSHISFFAPMARFSGGGSPQAAARDFKTMVKE